jgi:phytoene dehydrogenase-like protein
VVGGGTGDWDVPVGGMGRVSAALERARRAGAEIRVNATVSAVAPGGTVTLASGEILTDAWFSAAWAPRCSIGSATRRTPRTTRHRRARS